MNEEQLIELLKEVKKNGGAKKHNIGAPALAILVMSGAMDQVFGDRKPSAAERIKLIERMNKAIGSTAKLAEGKKGAIGIGDVDDELSRNIWMTSINPLHQFKLCDYYKNTLEMLGYKYTGKENIRFIKTDVRTGTGDIPIDILGSFQSMFDERSMAIYTNKNFKRMPAIVALYQGYETKSYGQGSKMRRVKLNDGAAETDGVIWPEYNTQDQFPPKIENALKIKRGTPVLVIGKLSERKGFKSLQINEIIPFA